MALSVILPETEPLLAAAVAQLQRALANGGRAGVGAGAGKGQRAGAGLGDAVAGAAVADRAGKRYAAAGGRQRHVLPQPSGAGKGHCVAVRVAESHAASRDAQIELVGDGIATGVTGQRAAAEVHGPLAERTAGDASGGPGAAGAGHQRARRQDHRAAHISAGKAAAGGRIDAPDDRRLAAKGQAAAAALVHHGVEARRVAVAQAPE